MSYQHLSSEERYYIEIERKKGKSFTNIGEYLDRAPSTISREVKRNTGQRGYRHKQAHSFTRDRHRNKAKAVKLE